MENKRVVQPFKTVDPLPKVDTREDIEKVIRNHISDDTGKEREDKLLEIAVGLTLKNQNLNVDLVRYENKHRTISINLIEGDLSNFFHFGECDQKLLAIMFWDKLTPEQKDIFSDEFFMEAEKKYQKNIEERMADPNKLRSHFLKGAAPILDDMLSMAKGDASRTSDAYAFKEVWEVIRGIINAANAKAPILDLKGKEVSVQIDEILTNVTAGKITFEEAKEYMSLVSSGFNLQELPKLMAKLDALEAQ